MGYRRRCGGRRGGASLVVDLVSLYANRRKRPRRTVVFARSAADARILVHDDRASHDADGLRRTVLAAGMAVDPFRGPEAEVLRPHGAPRAHKSLLALLKALYRACGTHLAAFRAAGPAPAVAEV